MTDLQNSRLEIAERAKRQVGTPFRLHGRTALGALDCVGVVLIAIEPFLPPDRVALRYSLKGEQLDRARSFLKTANFDEIADIRRFEAGDLVIARPGPLQLHFAVCADGGWIHADAGLGRVVFRPGALPWPIVGAWRLGKV